MTTLTITTNALFRPALARPKLILIVVGTLWLATTGSAICLLAEHSNSAGPAATPPSVIAVEQLANSHRLLLFLHPQCPCSRATISELCAALEIANSSVDVVIYAYRPESESDAWTQTDILDFAEQLPRSRVVIDAGAKVAEELQVVTSGQVLLYDQLGRLLFNGGVTSARGHVGANDARDALVECLRGNCGSIVEPVFGCRLY